MCRQPFPLKTDKGNFNVGCGKCYQCKAKRKQHWAFRLNVELKHASSACFVTLTYDDVNIPVNDGIQVLHKRDLQLFIKSLRNDSLKYYKEKYNLKSVSDAQKKAPQIRYFACGEYGEKTKRPHYHLLLFNYPYDNYDNIVNLWNKGHVHIGKVNKATIAYTSKYIMKDNSIEAYKANPMFNTMSRRPPIGHQYLKHKDYHLKNQEIMCKDQNGNLMLLPRIYRKKFFTELTEKKLLVKHFKEYEANLIKEEERLIRLGNDISMKELSKIKDELRRLERMNKQETI